MPQKCVGGRGSAPDPAGELTALPKSSPRSRSRISGGGRFAAGKEEKERFGEG